MNFHFSIINSLNGCRILGWKSFAWDFWHPASSYTQSCYWDIPCHSNFFFGEEGSGVWNMFFLPSSFFMSFLSLSLSSLFPVRIFSSVVLKFHVKISFWVYYFYIVLNTLWVFSIYNHISFNFWKISYFIPLPTPSFHFLYFLSRNN